MLIVWLNNGLGLGHCSGTTCEDDGLPADLVPTNSTANVIDLNENLRSRTILLVFAVLVIDGI